MTLNHLLRPKQAADWLGVSLSTFYKRMRQGVIPPPTYRNKNSVAWDSLTLEKPNQKASKPNFYKSNLVNKEKKMTNFDTQIVGTYVLHTLLSGQPVTRPMITEFLQDNPNTHLSLVMRNLRRTHKVIVYYSQINGGYWFMTPDNIVEFLSNPKLHAIRKEQSDSWRSQKRLNNNIANVVQKHKAEVIKQLFSHTHQ